MKQAPISIAKITAPRLPAVYPRLRLFKLLDRGRRMPVAWISGPAGSGKTTLAASWLDSRKLPCIWYQLDAGDADLASFFYYLGLAAKKAAPRRRKPLPLLTPEYLMDVPTFSRRYFEDLCTRVKPPFCIVFDNYQDVPPESPFHAVLAGSIAAVPEGVQVMCLSRTEPLPTFSGLIAGNKMEVVGWDDLRLSPDESRAIVGLLSKDNQDKKTHEWMYDRTRGWAAGIVLMARAVKAHIIDPGTVNALAPENVFDYFATELFARTDGKIRDFLVRTSVLPTMNPAVAEQLTGDSDAGKILDGLHRRNYFTYKSQKPSITFQYHPLFREFLQMQMKKSMNQEDITRLQQQAAKLLEESGQAEEAAGLFIETGDWQKLTGLILTQAQRLFSEGRSSTLETWISAIPGEMTDQIPWLLFWMGICRLPFNTRESRQYFERAFHRFDTAGDRLGALFAWCGVVDTYLYEFGDFTRMGKWAAWFKSSIEQSMAFPSAEVEYRAITRMLVALMFSVMDAREIQPWAERAMKLVHACTDRNMQVQTSVYTGLYYSWIGDLETLGSIVQDQKQWCRAPEATPFSKGNAKYNEAMHQWLTAYPDFGLRAASDALAEAASHGIHIADVHFTVLKLFAALSTGDHVSADECFEQMKSMTAGSDNLYVINYQYQYIPPWYSIFKGEFSTAYQQSLTSLNVIDESGGSSFHRVFSNITAAQALICMRGHAKAQEYIAEVHRIAGSMDSPLMEFSALLLEAQLLLERDRSRGKGAPEHRGLETLRQALALGKKRGYMNTFMWYAPAVTGLCITALENGIETEYVKRLIGKRKLMPETPPLHLESWPWPLKIFTLGRFRVEKDGKTLAGTVRFSRKVQQRPLELLKLLVALGGKKLGEERIIDALWPDAEGDAGGKSLSVTVARLRDLLGMPGAVTVADGAVQLNERMVWVDAWAFDALLQEAEERMRNADFGIRNEDQGLQRQHSALERALTLYQGEFLEGEPGHWAISPRERLRERFVRAALAAGRSREERGERGEAAEIYRRGLEADELVEQFYAGLMSCHRQQGKLSEALAVYRRCRSVFESYGLPLPDRVEAEHALVRNSGKS